MRTILAILMILVLASPILAQEVAVDIDRVVLLTPPQGVSDTAGSRIAVYFNLPDSIQERGVLYAEIDIDLDFSGVTISGDHTMELRGYNITEDWAAETADWNSLANDIDPDYFYTHTFEMSDTSRVFMDVTMGLMAYSQGETTYYGFMLFPRKFDEWVYQIDPSIVAQIVANARLRVVFL
jgi:hypothetical protein